MGKRLNEKVEENFNKGIRNYLDEWYNDRLYAPLGVDLRVKDNLVLRVFLDCSFDNRDKKNVPFSIHLEFAVEGNNGFEHFRDEEDYAKYFENYDVKKPKNEMDFFKKVYDVVDKFMEEYKQEALEDIEKMKKGETMSESKKQFKKSKLNEDDYMEKYRKETKDLVSDLEKEGFEITNYKTLRDKYFVYAVLNFKKELGGKDLENVKEIISTYGFYNKDESSDSQIIVDLPNLEDENLEEKSFKQFKSKAINEAELTELKDAIINREEFVDENVVGTSIGEDYIVSVFDKAVLIFTSDNTPFIIGREDLTEEEMDIVEELYSVLEISVDIDDEEGEEDYEEEDEEIFVDDNTSDDLEMTEKSLKESSYPKADKELKSVVKDLKDEFEISSSEVDKGVHGNDYAEEQGYDYLYVGKVTYKNEVSKDMLDEYKEWYEDVYGGRFDYDLNNKTIEFELGYGDDKDMSISMEKFMFESENKKKPSKIKKSLGESKKSKVKTLIKESGERVTTFKKGFDFKKYKSKV